MHPVMIFLYIVVGGVIIVVGVIIAWRLGWRPTLPAWWPAWLGGPPAATPPPAAAPTQPPPPPTGGTPNPPVFRFVTAPTDVVVATPTQFLYQATIGGFPYRDRSTRFEISVPNQNGVITAAIGEGSSRWPPNDGRIITTQNTARSNFPETAAGQIMIEIYIDHVTPDGAASDCSLTATDDDSGTTTTARFRGVTPP